MEEQWVSVVICFRGNISVIYKRSKSSVVSQKKKKNKVEKVDLNVPPTTQGRLQDNDDDDEEEEEEEGWGGGGGIKEPEEQDWRE